MGRPGPRVKSDGTGSPGSGARQGRGLVCILHSALVGLATAAPAAISGSTRFVDLSADVNATDRWGGSALTHAIGYRPGTLLDAIRQMPQLPEAARASRRIGSNRALWRKQ